MFSGGIRWSFVQVNWRIGGSLAGKLRRGKGKEMEYAEEKLFAHFG